MKRFAWLLAVACLSMAAAFAQSDDDFLIYDDDDTDFIDDEEDDFYDAPEEPPQEDEAPPPRRARSGIFFSIANMQDKEEVQSLLSHIALDRMDVTYTFAFNRLLYGGVLAGYERTEASVWNVDLLVGLSVELTEHIRPYVQTFSGISSGFCFDAALGVGLDVILKRYFVLNIGYAYVLRYDINSFLSFSTEEGSTSASFASDLNFQKVFNNPKGRYHIFSIGVGLTW